MLSQRHEKSSHKTSVYQGSLKKYSLRLPLRVASKIEALSEMHPQKKHTDLIIDLIDLGLAQVEHASSRSSAESPFFHPDTKQAIYLLNGPFSEFHGLIHKHHLAMEREIDDDDTDLMYPVDEHSLGRW